MRQRRWNHELVDAVLENMVECLEKYLNVREPKLGTYEWNEESSVWESFFTEEGPKPSRKIMINKGIWKTETVLNDLKDRWFWILLFNKVIARRK